MERTLFVVLLCLVAVCIVLGLVIVFIKNDDKEDNEDKKNIVNVSDIFIEYAKNRIEVLKGKRLYVKGRIGKSLYPMMRTTEVLYRLYILAGFDIEILNDPSDYPSWMLTEALDDLHEIQKYLESDEVKKHVGGFEEISPRAIYDKEIKELIDQMEKDLLFLIKNS
jgi:hypothetical protein